MDVDLKVDLEGEMEGDSKGDYRRDFKQDMNCCQAQIRSRSGLGQVTDQI